MASDEYGTDPGYDGSNTTGFVSPVADALRGPIDLAAMLDLRQPHCYPVRMLGAALVERGILPGDVLIADTATAPSHARCSAESRIVLHVQSGWRGQSRPPRPRSGEGKLDRSHRQHGARPNSRP